MDNIRKIHCVEMLKIGFDDLSLEKVKDMCGFYMPIDDDKWDVTLMFEGSSYTAESQFEAHVIANQEMMLAIQLEMAKDRMRQIKKERKAKK